MSENTRRRGRSGRRQKAERKASSALESSKLAREAVRALLAELRSNDRFLLLASDLTTRGHAKGFVAANADAAQ